MNVDNFDIGSNIKAIRKAKNLHAHDVIERLSGFGVEVSKSTYYAWEENSRPIPHKYILPLCMSLNITIDFLYNARCDSSLFKEKVEHVESVKNFLCMLDDDLCKMLILLARHWNGDFMAALIMLGTYSAQPVEMRRDVANLCLHNFLCAVRDGEVNSEIADLIDVEYYKKALEKLNKQ